MFPSLAAATNVANKTATSQIALPKATNDLVYATAGYEASVRNAAQVTLASDNVFSDGSSLELATMTRQRRRRLHGGAHGRGVVSTAGRIGRSSQSMPVQRRRPTVSQ